MNLSMHILKNVLREYHPVGRLSDKTHMINRVELGPPELSSRDINTVSVALFDDDNLSLCTEDASHIPTRHVAVHNNGDFLVLDTDDVNAVINRITDSFFYFNDWATTLSNAVYDSAPFDEIARILNEPFLGVINMLNWNGDILAVTADKFHDDPEWERMVQIGKITPKYLSMSAQDANVMEGLISGKSIKFIRTDDRKIAYLFTKVNLSNDSYILLHHQTLFHLSLYQ